MLWHRWCGRLGLDETGELAAKGEPKMRPDRGARAITVELLCTDPLVAEKRGVGTVRLTLPRRPGLGPGPTSARVAVVDYNADLDRIFAPARLLKSGDGFAIGRLGQLRRNVAFHQVNAWAVIERTLDLLEDDQLFGRPIPWASGLGRLVVMPHAGYERNAFYARDTGALHLFYFEGGDGQPVFTCLSHDVVTHELGHAVLDGLKPLYNEVSTEEAAGFHEYFGDALAISSALTFREILVHAAGRPARTFDAGLVAKIGEEFGSSMPGQVDYLRAATDRRTMADLEGNFEEHDQSQLLTNVFFSFLQWLYGKKLPSRHGLTGQDTVRALVNSAHHATRTFFRALDYCPPVDIGYLDYARAILRADEVGYPLDGSGARDEIRALFRARGVASRDSDFEPERRIENRDLHPFDVERLSATPEEAYRFLDSNRSRLAIPFGANLRVRQLFRTRKSTASGYRPPREVVLEFVWSEDFPLDGALAGAGARRFTIWCGGTIVFDLNGNVLSYALKERTPDREARIRRYLEYLGARGQVGFSGDDRRHPVVASLDGDRVLLRRVPALRHMGRNDQRAANASRRRARANGSKRRGASGRKA